VVRGYSGGMKRRLDVGLGLVHGPQVLFLDEPTTGLDPEARAAMWDELAVLAREELLTILLTTHYLEEADALTDRLAIVSRGRIVVDGSAEELKGRLEGEAVRSGQVICVVEAMKMENEITSHLDGTVTELSVEPGQAVTTGQIVCVVTQEAA
jgi:ABC-type multidrug transport system ATPase subunit